MILNQLETDLSDFTTQVVSWWEYQMILIIFNGIPEIVKGKVCVQNQRQPWVDEIDQAGKLLV